MSPTSRSSPEADVPRFVAVCTILGGPNGSGLVSPWGRHICFQSGRKAIRTFEHPFQFETRRSDAH